MTDTAMATAAQKAKVVFAIPELDQGGPDRVFFDLIRRLDRSRFRVGLILASSEGRYRREIPGDVEVRIDPILRQTKRLPVARFARIARSLEPSLIVSTLRMNIVAGLARRTLLRGVPLICRQANQFTQDFDALERTSVVKHKIARFVTRESLRAADVIVCQSRSMAEDLREVLGGRAALDVIGNPIDESWLAERLSATAPALGGRPSLISVGRLWKQKGFDLLLQALPIVRERFPDVHLTVMGEGPERAALQALAEKLGVAASVTFQGFVANPQAAMRQGDLFVLTSRYEGFSNALLEALACGLPAVVTDCPGANRDMIAPGINGFLSATLEPKAIAQAIVEGARIARAGGFNRQGIASAALSTYAIAKVVARYEELFQRVVAGRA